MSHTFQSEVGRIKSILIKPVQNAFQDTEQIQEEWQHLNYKGVPQHDLAIRQYEEFESHIRATGAEVHHLPSSEGLTMDSIYCRDAAIASDHGMIICNMGKDARKQEPEAIKKALMDHGFKILGQVDGEGTIEGGDVAWVDPHTLAVGKSYRTNPEGVRQLKALLEPNGVTVLDFDLPHWRGVNDIFHLMSIFSPIDHKKALIYPELLPIGLYKLLKEKGFQMIELAEDEYDNQGCNVLALAPSRCLMVEGSDQTKAHLIEAGCEVIEFPGTEIAIKGEGGPTCLTRPLERYI